MSSSLEKINQLVQSFSQVRLWDPMDCSMPGLPVHHQLLEFAQTHVHRVGDAIQSSHPLSYPSLPTFIFPSIRVFSNESVLLIRWPKYWSFSFSISPSSEYSGLISFRTDLTWSPCSPRDSQESLQHYSSKASILQHSAYFKMFSHFQICIWTRQYIFNFFILVSWSHFRYFCFWLKKQQFSSVMLA